MSGFLSSEQELALENEALRKKNKELKKELKSFKKYHVQKDIDGHYFLMNKDQYVARFYSNVHAIKIQNQLEG